MTVESISVAYNKIVPPKKAPKPGKKDSCQPNMPIELDMDSVDIVNECELNTDVGNKIIDKANGTPMNPQPIADKIKLAKVPDGSIWVVLYLKEGQLQIIKRSHDIDNGQLNIKVNSFNCKLIEQDTERIVLEADHINGGIEEHLSKDEQAFDLTACEQRAG